MSLKWKEISLLLEEARPALEGASLQKISQIKEVAGGETYLFHGFGEVRGPWKIWVCLQQEHTCWVFAQEDWKLVSQPEPSTFVMVLRKHLLGKRILKVEQTPGERFLFWHFDGGLSLLFELLPKKANLHLMENWNPSARSGKCIHSHRAVTLKPGAIYELPPPLAMISEESARDFSKDGGSYHSGVAAKYWEDVQERGFASWKRQWRQVWKSHRKKISSALENAKKDWEEAQEAERFHRMGMALVGHLYELGPKKYPKEKKIILDDIEIILDPAKSFSENSDAFFRKSKKFQRAAGQLEERVRELEKKNNELALVAEKIEKAESEEGLSSLEKEFRKEGLEIPELVAKRELEGKISAKPFLEIESSDGFVIYCGRNQIENRRVTFQESRGNDLWLHVKGMPGAHVVVKSQKNKTIPLSTLLEAAQVCLYHSKIRKGKRAEVDYTQRKYVRAIKGTPAEVTYTGNKTLYLEADPEVLRKVMKG